MSTKDGYVSQSQTEDRGRGRTLQKARTRAAIVDSAQRIARTESLPSVERAAAAAGVSRATAYRYFPTQEALHVELASKAAWLPVETQLHEMTSPDSEARLVALIDLVGAAVCDNEAHVRTGLRVYQDTWLRCSAGSEPTPVRRGRRKEWLDKVLEPLPSMASENRARLCAALALTVGPDPVVMLKDVMGLSPDEVTAVLRWAAVVLLRAALADTEAAKLPS
jgi:AcrR family transcriptional regulator